jgi:L-ribulose-5-phosphate 3-epimerase
VAILPPNFNPLKRRKRLPVSPSTKTSRKRSGYKLGFPTDFPITPDASPAAEYAGQHGVILGLENHGGITDKAENITQIVKQVNSPWVGINLDTANFKTRVYEQIEMIAPHAVNVQVKAMVRDEKGPAPSDWDRVAGMLVANNYRGYLALEYEEKAPALTATPALFKKLRAVCATYS